MINPSIISILILINTSRWCPNIVQSLRKEGTSMVWSLTVLSHLTVWGRMGRVCSPLQEKWSHPETMSHVCAGSVENGASIDLKALICLPRQAKPSLWRISRADHGLSHFQCSRRTRTHKWLLHLNSLLLSLISKSAPSFQCCGKMLFVSGNMRETIGNISECGTIIFGWLELWLQLYINSEGRGAVGGGPWLEKQVTEGGAQKVAFFSSLSKPSASCASSYWCEILLAWTLPSCFPVADWNRWPQ